MINNSESLFWKVFHNKFIRNNIIHQIGQLKTNGQRLKFKEIKTLHFFVKYQQELPLLKCKLESANEEIKITQETLSELFKFIFGKEIESKIIIKEEKRCYKDPDHYEEFNDCTYFFEKGEYKKGEEYIEIDLDEVYENEIKESQKQKEIIHNSKQIFQLLLKYRLKQIMKFKIIDIILELSTYRHTEFILDFDNQLFSELLFNEPYCNLIIIDEETIELAIKKSSASLLNKLLSNLEHRNLFNQVITNKIKNNSISWIGFIESYKEEMYESILNNQSLYSISPSPIAPQQSTPTPNKRLKSSDNSITSPQPTQQQQQQEVIKIDYYSFFNIKSEIIQIKLLNLNYFCRFDDYSEEFKEKVLIFFENNNSNDDCDNDRIKKLYKLFSNDPIVYCIYLSKYDEVIDGLNDTLVWEFSLLAKSVNALNYLLSKNKFPNLEQSPIIKRINLFGQDSFLSGKVKKKFEFSNRINEFIGLYTTNYHHFQVKEHEFENELLDYIFSIQSNHEYEIIMKSVKRSYENKELTDLIPEKWCNLPLEIKEKLKYPYGFLIQNTETIDFIFNDFNYITLWHDYCNIKDNRGRILFFKFQNYQLIDYAISKYGLNSMFFKNYPTGTDGQSGIHIIGTTNSLDITNYGNIKPSYFIYPYIVAINNCDIESLKHIDQLLGSGIYSNSSGSIIKIDRFEFYYPIGGIKYSKYVRSKIYEVEEIKGYSERININFNNQISDSIRNNIIQVSDYFNSTCYKLFSNTLFLDFIQDISKLNSSIIKINDLKINFKLIQNDETFHLFLELFFASISNDISPNLIQILLNNFNPFTNEMLPTVKQVFSKWSKSIGRVKDTSYYHLSCETREFDNYSFWCLYFVSFNEQRIMNGPFCCYSYESSVDIISCIEIIINHLKNSSLSTSTSTTTTTITSEIHEIIKQIINYLFKRLIKVNQVTIDQINRIYQLIKSTWLLITGGTEFIFEHTQYHVFFYLGIRSVEFMDYMLKLDYLLSSEEAVIEGFEDEFFSIGSPTQNLLDPTLFTYDYIFNSSSHDQIFETIKLNTTIMVN